MIDNPWYREGCKARNEGLSKSQCPYAIGSYGYAQWQRGFKEKKVENSSNGSPVKQ